MRDNGCFINCLEPKPQQLSYKIAYIKKVDGLTDGMENTHEMCQKIELHDTEPDNDLPEYTYLTVKSMIKIQMRKQNLL